jgi:hypothetical protein
MAWKIIATDLHRGSPDEEIYAIQIRFVGDSAEIHTTSGEIRLMNLNEFQLSSWTREELWENLRKVSGDKLWFEKAAN